MSSQRSENSYIHNDILPTFHSAYGYPIFDPDRVKINDVPIYRPSGGKTASTIDIAYYHNGVPLLLVEAKTKHKTHAEALKEALIYLKNFPKDKEEYSKSGKRPKYLATTVGNDIEFYKWEFDYSIEDFKAIPTDVLHFEDLLKEYGLSPKYKPKIINPQNFKADFFDELLDIFIVDRKIKIKPKFIITATEQILEYLKDPKKFYGQPPYIHLNLQKQKAVRDLFGRFDLISSLGPSLALAYRKTIVRAFQGGGFNQYLTEECIIDFMVSLIGRLRSSVKVLDFECGSGGFLASILNKYRLKLSNVKGIDIAELPFIVAKTYIALYFKITGRNKIENIPLLHENGLYNYGNSWDVVIGNPAGSREYNGFTPKNWTVNNV